MTGFEKLIRPFQVRPISPTFSVPQPGAPVAENVAVEAGRPGEGTIFHGNKTYSSSSYMDAKGSELSRKTHVNRIKNKDDPTQYIDVEVIDKLTTQGNTGQKYIKTNYEFKNKSDSPDSP